MRDVQLPKLCQFLLFQPLQHIRGPTSLSPSPGPIGPPGKNADNTTPHPFITVWKHYILLSSSCEPVGTPGPPCPPGLCSTGRNTNKPTPHFSILNTGACLCLSFQCLLFIPKGPKGEPGKNVPNISQTHSYKLSTYTVISGFPLNTIPLVLSANNCLLQHFPNTSKQNTHLVHGCFVPSYEHLCSDLDDPGQGSGTFTNHYTFTLYNMSL